MPETNNGRDKSYIYVFGVLCPTTGDAYINDDPDRTITVGVDFLERGYAFMPSSTT